MELIQKIKNSTLFRSAFNLMLSSGIISIFGFVFWIIIARNFTSHDVGIATTLISSALLISLLGQAGFDTTFIRFLPKAANKNAHINTGLAVSGIMSATIALVFCIASPLFSERLSFLATNPGYAAMFIGFVVFATWNTLTNAALIAYRKTVYVLIIDLLFSIVKVSLPFFIVSGGPMTIFMLVGIAQVVNVLLSIGVLMGKFKFKPKVQINQSVLREARKYSIGVYTASILNLLPDSLLPIIIINKLGASDSAYFYIAFAIANLVYTIAFAITQVLLAETAHDEKHFAEHARRGMGIAFALLTPAIIFVVFAAPFLLNLFGKSYASGGLETLRIMVWSGFFVLFYSFLGFYYKHTKMLIPNIIMTAVNAISILGLSIILIPHYGLAGVGWAWLAGTIISVMAGMLFFILSRHREARTVQPIPRRILITHVYSKDNKGDAALLSVLISTLRNRYRSVVIDIEVSDNKSRNDVFDNVNRINESLMFIVHNKTPGGVLIATRSVMVLAVTTVWALFRRYIGLNIPLGSKLNNVLQAYYEADLIVPVGGGYMRGQGRALGSLLHTLLLLQPLIIANILNKPVVMYSQSFGPFTTTFEQIIVSAVLKRCTESLITREGISYNLLKSMHLHNIEQSIDSGFLFSAGYRHYNLRKSLKLTKSTTIVGITAKKYLIGDKHRVYVEEMAQFIDKISLEHKDTVFVFIPQVIAQGLGADDRDVHREIYTKIINKSRVYLINREMSHRTIRSLYNSLDYMVGTRFHSVIFALSSFVPSIAIEYEHKTSGIMNDLSLSKWVVPIENLNATNLAKMFNLLLKKSDSYKKHLIKAMPEYKKRASNAIEIVDNAYRNFVRDNNT